jgi:hypothetical protein
MKINLFIMVRFRNLTEKRIGFKFRKLGFQLNLAISHCEMLGAFLMGLDLERKKLVIADYKNRINYLHTVEIDALRSISVRKEYNAIRPGELKVKKMSDFIKSIQIRMIFRDGRDAIVLPVYRNNAAGSEEIHQIDLKISRWYNMLSGLVYKTFPQAVKRA